MPRIRRARIIPVKLTPEDRAELLRRLKRKDKAARDFLDATRSRLESYVTARHMDRVDPSVGRATAQDQMLRMKVLAEELAKCLDQADCNTDVNCWLRALILTRVPRGSRAAWKQQLEMLGVVAAVAIELQGPAKLGRPPKHLEGELVEGLAIDYVWFFLRWPGGSRGTPFEKYVRYLVKTVLVRYEPQVSCGARVVAAAVAEIRASLVNSRPST